MSFDGIVGDKFMPMRDLVGKQMLIWSTPLGNSSLFEREFRNLPSPSWEIFRRENLEDIVGAVRIPEEYFSIGMFELAGAVTDSTLYRQLPRNEFDGIL